MILYLFAARYARSIRRVALLIAAAAIVAGCATPSPAPVEERPAVKRAGTPSPGAATQAGGRAATYTVKRGDTLYLIALDHGLDYRELAAWNHIANVDRIYVGEVLQLAAPGQAGAAPGSAGAAAVAAGSAQIGPTPVPGNAPAGPGVTVTPLRVEPPIVSSAVPLSGAAPGPVTGTALPSGTAPPTGTAIVPPGPTASAAPVAPGGLETEPRAVKLPYSDRAVRELNLAASSVPAPSPGAAPTGPGPVAAASGDVATPSSAPGGPSAVSPAGPTNPKIATAAPSLGSTAQSPGSPTAADDQLGWVWPAKGKVIGQFSDSANLKGIDIAGTMGEPIYASAAGKVVYAGSGLRGYGKLIIIKHNATYLSAYAHNSALLVKEGQQVARGQEIAQMGNTDADKVMLHFEIRRYGKPMDPEKFLPPA